MSRPAGRRNADFDASRVELLDRILHSVAQSPHRSSFAELAEVSGVARTTLRHYFGSREELLQAMLEHMEVLGQRAEKLHPEKQGLPLEDALRERLRGLVFAWRVGVGALFVAGLLWGLGDEKLGPIYVRSLLEPLLVRCERQLGELLGAQGMTEERARHAALALLSPVILALLHQESLYGVKCRPLDIDAFIEEHLQSFLRGWGA
jgi:AcrR family transcriptional regulator